MREGERLFDASHRLVRIAEVPQDAGEMSPTTHSGMFAKPGELGRVELRVRERNALLQMGASQDRITKRIQRRSQGTVGLDQQRSIVYTLGHVEQVLCQLPCGVEFRAQDMKAS